MAWQRLSAVVTPELAEAVGEALEACGAVAVTLVDGGQQPLYEPPPGATPMWRATRVEGLFSADADWETVASEVTSALALEGVAWRRSFLEDQAWERAWMERFQPMRAFWISETDLADGTGERPYRSGDRRQSALRQLQSRTDTLLP